VHNTFGTTAKQQCFNNASTMLHYYQPCVVISHYLISNKLEIKLLSYYKKFPLPWNLKTPSEHQKHNCAFTLYTLKTMNDDLKLLWMTFLDDLHFISHNSLIYLENSGTYVWVISFQIILSNYINSLPFAVITQQPPSCHSWRSQIH